MQRLTVSLFLCVCVLVMTMSLAKASEPIEILFIGQTQGPKDCIVDGSHFGATWRIRWIDLYGSGDNNNNHDNVYSDVIMTRVIARVHPVHLINLEWVPGGCQPTDQAGLLGLWVRRKLAATIHVHHCHCYCYLAHDAGRHCNPVSTTVCEWSYALGTISQSFVISQPFCFMYTRTFTRNLSPSLLMQIDDIVWFMWCFAALVSESWCKRNSASFLKSPEVVNEWIMPVDLLPWLGSVLFEFLSAVWQCWLDERKDIKAASRLQSFFQNKFNG